MERRQLQPAISPRCGFERGDVLHLSVQPHHPVEKARPRRGEARSAARNRSLAAHSAGGPRGAVILSGTMTRCIRGGWCSTRKVWLDLLFGINHMVNQPAPDEAVRNGGDFIDRLSKRLGEVTEGIWSTANAPAPIFAGNRLQSRHR